MISGRKALERLREGNGRFARGDTERWARTSSTRREEIVEAQHPFAIVLGCSDSRVPTVRIFDQGLGDLFVIRVAGNVVTPAQAGSIEMCVDRLGAKLIVVLGHSHCGAIQVAFDELEGRAAVTSPNLRSILDCIQPSMKALIAAKPEQAPETLLREAARTNVRTSVERLQQISPLLRRQVEHDGLLMVGAMYSLKSGMVDFFDGPPAEGDVPVEEGDVPVE